MLSVTPARPPMAAKPYFPALTGLRAVAAWLVFLYHATPFDEDGLPGRIVGEFHVGVTFFFVLSGLLLCLRYGAHIELSRTWLGHYVYRRFIRIYPLYFLLTCALLVVYQLAPQYDVDRLYTTSHLLGKVLFIVLNLTLLRGWFSQFRYMGIGAGWTLTVEEFFYLLAPLLVLVLRRRPARVLWYAAGFLAVGCALVALPAPWHPFGFLGTYQFMLSGTFFGRCLEFLAGIYLGVILLRRASLLRYVSQRAACTAVGIVWIIACIGVLAMVRGLTWQPHLLNLALVFMNNVALVPGICLLLYGLMYEPSPLRRVLSSRPFDLLGKASYAFYLIHAGLLSRFLDLHVPTSPPLNPGSPL